MTHLVFEHDSSQIMNRRQVLSDDELNLSLGAAAAAEPAPAPDRDLVAHGRPGDA